MGNFWTVKFKLFLALIHMFRRQMNIFCPGGTGYISDLGMTGIMDSILGVKKEIILNYYYNAGKHYRF